MVAAPDSAISVINLTTGTDLVPLPATGNDMRRVWQLSKLNEFNKRIPIARGNYEAILNAGLIISEFNANLDGNRDGVGGDDYHTSFFFQPGDANHDRTVSGDDYTAIDFNYSQSGVTGHQNGDFNYDGFLSSDDYTVIDFWAGTVLPPPPTEPGEMWAGAGREFIDLEWVSPVGVADLDGFGLWRSLDGGENFSFHAFTTETYFLDDLLADGTKYTYRVRAHSASAGYSHTGEKISSVTNMPGAGVAPTVSNITADALTLTWPDNTSNESGFHIERTGPTGVTILPPIPAQNNPDGKATFRVTNLTPNTAYTFRVRAYTAAQESAWSPTVKIITSTSPDGPVAPTMLTATAVSSSQINLAWTDNSTNETTYEIESSLDGTEFVVVATIGVDATSYAFTEAFPNMIQWFRVRASNVSGLSGSEAVSALTAPRAPEGLTATEVGTTQVDVTWDGVANLASYMLERRTNGGAWGALPSLGGSVASYSDSGLTEGTQYEYRLAASNGSGVSEYSQPEGTFTLPEAPSGLTATAVAGPSSNFNMRVDLEWADNSASEANYVIERSFDGSAWEEIASAAANSTSFSVTAVAGGVNYSFRARSRNTSGKSSASNVATTTPPSDASDYGVLETISVPLNGSVVRSTATLATGVTYKIRASGTAYAGIPSDGMADAEYGNFANPQNNGAAQYGSVDYGIGINDTTNDASKNPSWGAYNGDHVYVVDFVGQGATIGLNFHDDFLNDNTGQLKVEILVPKVTIRANRPQAAEGGSEPGQFTVERTGDTSKALDVTYTVATGSGHATPGTDYTALSGSVTISAGSRTATIDVAGLADTDRFEQTETVTVTIDDVNKPYKADSNAKTASVAVLNKEKYLVAFYGFGPIAANAPGFAANQWLRGIAEDAAGATGATLLLKPENREREVFEELVNDLNADADKTLSKAEAESVDLSVMGYSFGGVQAFNFSHKLNRVGTRYAGVKLTNFIKIAKLLTIDPNKVPVVKEYRFGTSVPSNVTKSLNYAERTGQISRVRLYNGAQFIGTSEWGGFNASIRGDDFLPGTLRVDTDPQFQNRETARAYLLPTDPLTGKLLGSEVNHGTVLWYIWDDAVSWLTI